MRAQTRAKSNKLVAGLVSDAAEVSEQDKVGVLVGQDTGTLASVSEILTPASFDFTTARGL